MSHFLLNRFAQEVGMSYNHLTRLFQSAIGKTVKNYMQEQRMGKSAPSFKKGHPYPLKISLVMLDLKTSMHSTAS